MKKAIVVGLDASPSAAEAMSVAVDIAVSAGGTVIPVHAWEYPALCLLPFPAGLPVPPPEVMQEDAETRASQLIEAFTDGYEGELPMGEHVVVEGSAAYALCGEAERQDAHLLVLGTRGLSGFKSTMVGSVTAGCARRSPCPVVIVPEGSTERKPSGVVVVGVDGSAASNAAIKFADAWAPEDAVLLLVHAWNLPASFSGMVGAEVATIEQGVEALLEAAVAQVEHHKTETRSVRGDARVELENLADTADMVVIGARGHSGLGRFLLGSVAEYTIHHVAAPTVIVPDEAD